MASTTPGADVIDKRQIMPHLGKELAIAERGICFPLKGRGQERANGTLEGLAEQQTGRILELPAEAGEATVVVEAVTGGDSWHATKAHWSRLHVVERRERFVPRGTDDGPELSAFDGRHLTI